MSANKPTKWTDAPCPRCGTPERVMNPAWLRHTRQQADLSLREFATRVGFSAAYLCDVEKGRRYTTPKIVAAYEALR